jgi:hypothetical protein
LAQQTAIKATALRPEVAIRANQDQQVRAAKSYKPETGPWGELEARALILEPPDWLAKKFAQNPALLELPVWLFLGETATVLEMLKVFGIDSDWAAELKAAGAIKETAGGVEFRPPRKFLQQLTSNQREELFGYVAPFERGNPYHNPFSLHPNGFGFMASMSPPGLSETMIDQIDRLSFQRKGKGRYFSDLHLCFQDASGAAERMRIFKTINRQFSLRVQLRISRDSNLSDLIHYWGSNGRNGEVVPLLEAVAENPAAEMLDIIHLLPPVPRLLLHSYPIAEMVVDGERPDCFSTSVSFFADEPPTRYLDSIRHVLEARYEKALPPWQFGDLILMRDPDSDGKFEHACNYIAADIVFTKNGSDLARPWILARISDVMEEYLTNERLSASFFRLKPEYRR